MSKAESMTTERPEGAPVVDFDLLSHNTMAISDAAWDELRRKAPIAWSDDNGGAWIVSGYSLVQQAFQNADNLKSGRAVTDRPGPGGSPDLLPINAVPVQTEALMIPEELDAPLWHPYRRVFAELLSPKGIEALRPRVKYWTTKMLDDIIESGRCDIVDTFVSAVPGAVICEWLGFPEEEWHRLAGAFHNMASYIPGSPTADQYLSELEWVFDRIADEVTAVRENPRDDIASLLANTVVDGERTSYQFAKGMVNMAMSGGVDTVTSVVSAALLHLHKFPEDRQKLIDEPELIDRALEEFLRVYPPARTHGRTVIEDTELGGYVLRKDDRVIISEVSANRDENAFPDANTFVMDRFPNRHVTFGIGPHRCPGSHVARAMLKEMVVQVLERMPDYQVVEEETEEYVNWTAQGGWSKMVITFTPGERRL